MLRRRTTAIILAGALVVARSVPGVEYAVPSAPQSVAEDTVGTEAVTWVDWGAAGGARARDPALILEEQDDFRRFLRSPELTAALLGVERHGAAKETELLRARMAAWHLDYATREQCTAFPRSDRLLHDCVPLPLWAWGVPMEIRRAAQILIFDDRDPAQRDWVLDHCHEDGRLSFAYCTGWRSGDDRDAFWKRHPVLEIHGIATDQFPVFYGVSQYPARIRFDATTMDVVQGMDR
jgi:hypothetical protein